MHSLLLTRRPRLLAILGSALVLAACVGDGDGQESIPGTPQPPLVGVLLDAPVAGVSYETSQGRTGITNSAGRFEYLATDMVTFTVGGVMLGTAPGAPYITAVELTGSADPTQTAALNQLVFLQSLDTDADLSNGIEVDADAQGRAANQTLDFTAADFDTRVAEVVAAITEPDNAVVSEDDALLHFYQTYADLGGTDTLAFPFPGFPPVGGGVTFELVFADEFNEGTAPSPERWTIETGYGPNNNGWGNNEWQLYTASPDNVRVEDGNLVLEARCDTPPCGVRDGSITSGKINTLDKFNFKFGKVQARIKPPVGDGAWPAFWSLGANHPQVGWPRSGEMDFMEMHNAFSNERTTHFTVHWCDETIQAPAECTFPDGWIFDSQNRTFPESLGDDFHIFEADWDGDRIIGSIDGIPYYSRTINAATMEEFLKEFYMILNVAMGGTLGSDNQPPNGNETWPQTMLVDWVRVFQRVGGSEPAEDTLIDFEDAPETYDFGVDGGFGGGAAAVVDNPVAGGVNTSAQVGRMLKFQGEVFAGSKLTLPSPVEFPDGGTFTMKVWSPRQVNVLFKLEGPTEAEVNLPHGGSGWEEMSFAFPNFSGSVEGITLIFDLGIVGDAQGDPDNWTFYFDDILLPTGDGGDPGDNNPPEFNGEFEGAPESYDFGLDGGFGGGAAAVIANPVPGGINTSAQVVRMLKFQGEVFAGSKWTLPTPLDVPSGTVFKMKVWSPRVVDVLLKLEGAMESEVNIAHGGTGWEELTYDFGSFSGTVEGITVIFDLGIVGDAAGDPDNWTFYFDDITFIPPGGGDPGGDLNQIDLPITFDDPTVDYSVIDFGMPTPASTTLVADPDDATNTVASTTKPTGAPVWAGTTMSTAAGFASAIPFTANQTTIGIRVYSPDAGIPVRLKAEDEVGGMVGVETEAMTTVANQWETLVFDFANEVEGDALDLNASYAVLSVFFNFGTDGDTAGTKTYLWDDVEFGVEAPIVDTTPPTLTTVSIASSNANPALATTGDVITVTLTADEAIMAPTVTIGGAPADAVTGAVTNWQASRTLTAADPDGAVAFSIEFSDEAGNAGTSVSAATDASAVTIDAATPTVAIQGAPASFAALDPVTLTFQFSEPVSGFDLNDIQTTNGSAAGFASVDASTYTAALTPNGTGDLTIGVLAGAATDAAGNLSEMAAAVTIVNNLDADAPLLTAIGIASNNANPDFARTGDVVTITMTANEDIVAPVVSIAGAPADVVTGAGTNWQASRTALATDAEGPVAFVINFQDLGGNAGPQSTVTTDASSVTFDISGPALSIAGVPATVGTLDPIPLTFQFDEDVTGFDAADVVVSNGAAGALTIVDAANYTTSVTPDGNGDLTVAVAADAATDAAGNGSVAASVSGTLDLQPAWQLVWSDSFDGAALDGANWTARTDADCPGACAGIQTYSGGQVSVVGGMLTIAAQESAGPVYTSGLIDTRGKMEFKYGRVEIDARMPATQGAAPSLWMLPTADTYGPWPLSGQIDVANAPDLGAGNQIVEHTLHYGLPVPEDTATTGVYDSPTAPDSTFLTYALEWEAGEIRWFVDGVHVFTQIQDNWYAYSEDADGVYTLGMGAAPFDQDVYLVLSLAVGGNAGAGSTFPQALQIDAVRVYECANAIDPAAGTGCSTADPGVMPLDAPGAPYTEMLDVYTDAPAVLDFVDPADPGNPVSNALVPDTSTSGAGVTVNSDIAAADGANTVWNVDIAAAAGNGGVFMRAPSSGFFDLSGGETAAELLFRLRVTSALPGTQLMVGIDSGAGTGRTQVPITADSTWRQQSVKVADLVTDSIMSGTGLDLGKVDKLFAIEAINGAVTLDLDDIQVIVACRDDGGCEATPRLPAETAIYGPEDFEGIDISGTTIGVGWKYFINVFESGTPLFSYNGSAPNGPQISAIATGEGGMNQGTQQLSIYSDYECCAGGGPGGSPSGHRSANGLVETNVFQEPRAPGASAISADDVGTTWTFRFDAKRGNVEGSSQAIAFIKVLDPGSGFSTTAVVTQDMTTASTDWTPYSIDLTIGDWVGQILQFGFQTNASNFEGSGVFYDNIEVVSVP